MITAHGVEIKSISDFDKAAKQSPEVKAVDAWHKVYAAQRKVVMDFSCWPRLAKSFYVRLCVKTR